MGLHAPKRSVDLRLQCGPATSELPIGSLKRRRGDKLSSHTPVSRSASPVSAFSRAISSAADSARSNTWCRALRALSACAAIAPRRASVWRRRSRSTRTSRASGGSRIARSRAWSRLVGSVHIRSVRRLVDSTTQRSWVRRITARAYVQWLKATCSLRCLYP